MRILLKGLALITATVGALALYAGSAVADPMPLPANANTSNPEVSIHQTACNSSAVCFAVGSYETSSYQQQGLIETEQNGTWSASEAPLPGDSSNSSSTALLQAITCDGLSCVAVGQYSDSSGNLQGLIDGYLGNWTAQTANLSGIANAATDPEVALDSISCVDALYCVAVGSYLNRTGMQMGLIGYDFIGSWAFTQAPTPTGARNVNLLSVDCPSDKTCEAVGGFDDATGAERALVISGWGTSWTELTASLPSNAVTGGGQSAALNSVSCPTNSECFASGQYVALSGSTEYSEGMVATGSGTGWAVGRTPFPAGANSSQTSGLGAVSCSVLYNCLAVGSYTDAQGDVEGLIDTYSSGAWSASTAPLPAGAASGGSQTVYLNAVDCHNGPWCALVGSYVTSAKQTEGLVETGTSFSLSAATSPLPQSTPGAGLISVSCPAVSSCVAAGDYEDTAGRLVGAVAGSPPQPAAPTITAVDGVAYVTMTPSTGGLPITGYIVTANDITNSARGGQKVNTAGEGAGNIAFFNDLTVGDSYTFTVVATNVFGDSPPVTSAVQRIPSLANIKASLKPLLHPTGAAAKIKSLRKSHGFKFIYSALEAGQVTVDWYNTTGHGKHKHRALVATGVANTSAGAKVPVRVTLNGAGKRLLASSKKVALSATATFTMTNLLPISVSGSFTLR